MKMNYSPTNNKRINKTIITGILLAVLLITINMFFKSVFLGFLHSLAGPIWKAETIIKEDENTNTLFSFKKSLLKENEKLREEMLSMQVENLKFKTLQKENRELKTICNREGGDKDNAILSKIIKKPGIGAIYDIFVIDIGEDKNIKKGDIALSKSGLVVGRVESVFKNTSKVKLFSSPGKITKATLEPAGVEIEALGLGSGNFKAEIPKGINAKVDDILTVPALNMQVFAKIEEIEEDPANPFETIYFKLPIDIFKESWIKLKKQK